MTKYKQMLEITTVIADAIKASGKRGIPSGHLYAALMGKMSLTSYQNIIDVLVRAKLITDSNHLLVWRESDNAKTH